MTLNISTIETKIGVIFTNKDLLWQALTHSTYARYIDNFKNHNEQLAVFGDSLLNFIVVDYLYQVGSKNWEKGFISDKRDTLVSDKKLEKFARQIELVNFIRVKNEDGKISQKNVTDTFEALVAAIYLDKAVISDSQGLIEVQNWFIKKFVDNSYVRIAYSPNNNNLISALQTEEFEVAVNLTFNKKSLLQQALTQSSSTNKYTTNLIEHNEALAILGDTLLDFITLHYLYNSNNYCSKGLLSKERDLLVCNETLLKLTQQIKLKQFIRHNGIVSSKNIADTFKALLAAIYLDQGFTNLYKWFITQLPTDKTNRLKKFRYKSLSTRDNSLDKEELSNSVDLHSAIGVDYSQLMKLLVEEKWEEADLETKEVMLKVAGLMKESSPLNYLSTESINKFPCIDLGTIDQLWVNYSDKRFGFTIQQQILSNVGKDWDKFGECVGWRVKGIWQSKNERVFNLSAPVGHLPSAAVRAAGKGKLRMLIFSRVETCKL